MAVLRQNYETRVKPKLGLIEGWVRNGVSITKICENLGISQTAFDRWSNTHLELRDAVERGRECAEIHVENAMLKRALGYTYWEVTKERKKVTLVDSDTGEEFESFAMIPTRKVLKHVIPDVAAQQYWLENRANNKWKRAPKDAVDNIHTNEHILSIAELLNNPMPERKQGEEEQEWLK